MRIGGASLLHVTFHCEFALKFYVDAIPFVAKSTSYSWFEFVVRIDTSDSGILLVAVLV